MESALKSDAKLCALIKGIATSVQTETKCGRADQIRDAIEVHLKTWLDEVEQLNPLFKVSELIQVGSYAEGTKIVKPDEFDFLAVIDDLSQPGSVIIDESASDLQESLVRVAVADDKLKPWSKLCKDSHLQCFQRIPFPDLGGERFGHVFISVLKKKVKEFHRTHLPTIVAFISPFDISCEIPLPAENSISLLLNKVEYWTPNVLINFELENREITVDLSPAIRYHKIEDCFKVEDCAGPAFADLVLSQKSLLLVGTKSKCAFKVTVTEAEVQFMKSVMKPKHKDMYIFLKYLVKLYSDKFIGFTSFTSYMLKTVCIHHDIKCMSEETTIKTCLKSVIEELEECTRQNAVHSIMNRHLCLSFHVNIDGSYERIERNRKCVIDCLREICQLPPEVNTVEDLDYFIKGLVRHEEQRRDEEELREKEERQKRLQLDQYSGANVVSNTNSTGGQVDEEAVSQIVEMGFEREEVRKAMRTCLNDPTTAVEYLLNGTPVVIDEEATPEESHTRDNRAPADKVSSSSDRESYQTFSESSSGGKNTVACELLCIQKPNEESQQSSSIEQGKITCEILYQRQKQL